MNNKDELKVEDINKSYGQKRAYDDDVYWQRRSQRRGNIRKKKVDSIKKKIKYSAYVASIVALLAIGKLVSQKKNQSEGTNYIINKFNQVEENYDKIYIFTSSEGARVARTSHNNDKPYYIDPLEGIRYIDTVGKSGGLSEAERYIVEVDKFGGFYQDEINDYFENVTMSDVVKAKEVAYHESELENIKGVSR